MKLLVSNIVSLLLAAMVVLALVPSPPSVAAVGHDNAGPSYDHHDAPSSSSSSFVVHIVHDNDTHHPFHACRGAGQTAKIEQTVRDAIAMAAAGMLATTTTKKEDVDKVVRGGGGGRRRRQLNTESLYQALLQLYGGQKPPPSSSGSNVKVALKKSKPTPPKPTPPIKPTNIIKPLPTKPTNIIKPLPTKPTTNPKPIVTNIWARPEQGCSDKCAGLEYYMVRGYTCYEVIGSCYGFRWQCRRGLRADAAENDPKDKNENDSMVVGSTLVSKNKDGEYEKEEEDYRNHHLNHRADDDDDDDQDDEEQDDDYSFFCDQAKAAAAAALSALGDTTIDHHENDTNNIVLTNECRAALSTHYDHLEITTCASSSSSS